MKIRHKLSLFFSLAGASILLLFGIAVYLFSSNHREEAFDNRISQRVNITEKMLLERDAFTKEEFETIKEQFLHTLPEEHEDVIALSENPEKHDRYSQAFINKTVQEKMVVFRNGDRQGISKLFHVDGTDYIVVVTAIDKEGLEKLTYLKGIIGISLFVGIILFTLLSIPISEKIIQPLSYKIRLANMISENNLHQRLTGISSNDEIGELAVAFNGLLDRIESAFEAKKSFISNASHEIRNPLTAIINETDIALEKERTVEDYREALHSISQEAERLNLLADNLLELSKVNYSLTPLRFEFLPLRSLLHEVVAKIGFTRPESQITLSDSTPELEAGIWGNRNLMFTALLNIIDNACKFSSNAPVGIDLFMEDNQIGITVTDQGIGIPEEEIALITEPFFRSSNARTTSGSGIGITLAAKIIQIHRGMLRIDSVVSSGTSVTITLPTEEHLKA